MLEIKTGNDIVYLPEFSKKIQNENFIKRICHKSEINGDAKSLAGIFSLKESCIKALGIPVGRWHDMEIIKDNAGKPTIKLSRDLMKSIKSYDCSISHDKDYVISSVVFLLEK